MSFAIPKVFYDPYITLHILVFTLIQDSIFLLNIILPVAIFEQQKHAYVLVPAHKFSSKK